MIGLRLRLDTRPVDAAFRRTRARGPKITAQELNAQRRQSRTRITRRLATELGVRPQRRIRNRIRLPLTGAARPERLRAIGLALVHIMPARWFLRGRKGELVLPSGVKLIEGAPATGRPFTAEARRGAAEVFRRGARPRQREKAGEPTWLPIKTQNADTGAAGDRAISAVVAELAREWPKRWEKRMERELRRIWGA